MLTRLVAAAVGLAVVLPLLVFGGTWGLEALVGVVVVVGLHEYGAMAFPEAKDWARFVLFPTGLLLYASVLYAPPALIGPTVGLLLLVCLMAVLFRSGPVDEHLSSAARLWLGLGYVAALLSLLPLIRRHEFGLAWIFLMLAVVWAGDSGAYFTGRAFGSTKLYEKISPKKTWEGVVGGLAGSVGGALLVRHFGLPDTSVSEIVVLALVLGAGGVVGDLVESMIKRSAGVKDSGTIMPGHGGILDRVDSLLFSGALLWAWLVVSGA